ncbi:protease [Salmonella enterica subsp. enterica serovar Cotham]|nr:protease [Salmonella enterica]EBS0793827.1 protease [Salmonella enterica subsp. enterica serovar Overschie]ECN8535219.1 protease [Salmonella enterica subsp. enterica serovar Kentucky]EEP9806467.1 protease [Salmonella enterica subsp. diarizonae]EIT8811326.1 protease [Salmonella enterica subsp. enterica serovar Cotham]HBM0008737.1 protease [Salmonella enterica subsp. enterica serovar Dahra]
MDHRFDPFSLSCFLLIYRKPTPSPDRHKLPAMTTNTLPRKTAYAVLNAATLSPFDNDGWCQAMPAGRVKARDGRPEKPPEGWLINQAAVDRMVARVVALNQPIKIDYNHQSLFRGEAAPAAGFIHPSPDNFRFSEERGFEVRPDWNPPAVPRLVNKEFPWFSPVMGYDEDSGEPVELRMLAVTGDPGLTGMNPVAALSADDLFNALNPTPVAKEKSMNEQLRQLLAAFGLTVPDDGELTPELGTAALSALTDIQAKAGKHDELKTQVATLSAELDTAKQANTTAAGGVDLTKFVPVETYDTLRTEYVALSAQLGTTTLEQVLDKAEDEGRVFKSERSYLEGLGKQIGVAALSAQLDARQPIAALTAKQTDTVNVPKKKNASAALSAEDLQVMKMLGKTEEEFLKAKGVNQ